MSGAYHKHSFTIDSLTIKYHHEMLLFLVHVITIEIWQLYGLIIYSAKFIAVLYKRRLKTARIHRWNSCLDSSI